MLKNQFISSLSALLELARKHLHSERPPRSHGKPREGSGRDGKFEAGGCAGEK